MVSKLRFSKGQPLEDLLVGRKILTIQDIEDSQLQNSTFETVPIPTSSFTDENNLKKSSGTILLEGNSDEKNNPRIKIVAPSLPPVSTTEILNLETPKSQDRKDDSTPMPVPPSVPSVPTLTDDDPTITDANEGSVQMPVPAPPAQPAPTFDPFASEPPSLIEVKEPATPMPVPAPPAPPAPTFDPFASEPPSLPEVKEPATPMPIPAPPVPPTPTFDPFASEPPSLPEVKKPATPMPVPAPPAPTFDPFQSDSTEIEGEGNQTSIPLENIFNSPPPEIPPTDGFNPFDLPTEK